MLDDVCAGHAALSRRTRVPFPDASIATCPALAKGLTICPSVNTSGPPGPAIMMARICVISRKFLVAIALLLHHLNTVAEAKMDLDEATKKRPDMVIGENLDAISIAELEQRIVVLDSEINRLRGEIAKKTASKAAAASFFRT